MRQMLAGTDRIARTTAAADPGVALVFVSVSCHNSTVTTEQPPTTDRGWGDPTHHQGPTITQDRAMTVVFVVVLVVVVGLVALRASIPGFGVADRIGDARSPLVRDASYHVAIFGGGGWLNVDLVPGVTKAQAHEVWCDVVVPAMGDHLDEFDIAVLSRDLDAYGIHDELAGRSDDCTGST
jgi:hypothetical protein